MTKKGVAKYRRQNPGSKLKTAVTEKNPKGKRAARRKSFCARSAGQMKKFPKAAKILIVVYDKHEEDGDVNIYEFRFIYISSSGQSYNKNIRPEKLGATLRRFKGAKEIKPTDAQVDKSQTITKDLGNFNKADRKIVAKADRARPNLFETLFGTGRSLVKRL